MLKNPLDVNVTLTDVTLVIRESNVIEPSPSKLSAEIEVIEDVIIGAKETRTVCAFTFRSSPYPWGLTFLRSPYLSKQSDLRL